VFSTHCKRGHPFDEVDTYPDGKRFCRMCRRERDTAGARRRRGAKG
jgi:hypothetical protein